MSDKREICHVYIEDPKMGTVMLLRYGSGEKQGKWTVPGGLIDEKKDSREQAKKIVESEIGVEVELYPIHRELEYPEKISHVFKGRLVDVEPEPGEVYSNIKNVSYDNLMNINLEGEVSADLKRLGGSFFNVYKEGF